MPQPSHRSVEESSRALPGGPGSIANPADQLVLDVAEVPPPVFPGDLPLMLEAGLLPLQVCLHTGGIGNLKLGGDVVDRLGRHIQGIG